VEHSPIALAQIFEPIRADLEQVDQEFARHVQSQVDLIPKIGQYIQTRKAEPLPQELASIIEKQKATARDLTDPFLGVGWGDLGW
jgi:hypothetical protein